MAVTSRTRLSLLSACLSIGIACGGGGSSPTSPTTSTTTTTTTTTTPTTPGGSGLTVPWTSEGVRINAAQAGQTSTQVFADATVIRLTDGRWRMFMFANTAYRGAISSDGLSFTMESGFKMREGAGQARAFRLDDGRIRMFFSSNGIMSAISTDEGASFTEESGLRLTTGAAGMSALTGPGVVKLRNGTYRMYFSDLPIPGEGVKAHLIKSATSADTVSWTMDSGVRVGTGATLSGNAEHPCACVNSDGSVTIFYFRNTDLKLYQSTATDGVTFSTEAWTGLTLNDPDIVTLSDGTVRLFGGGINASGGFIESARRANAANAMGGFQFLAPPAVPLPQPVLTPSFAAPSPSGTTSPARPAGPGGRAIGGDVPRGQ